MWTLRLQLKALAQMSWGLKEEGGVGGQLLASRAHRQGIG